MQLPCIVIPVFEPDGKLVELVRTLKADGFSDLIVVDDGSGPTYQTWFEQCAALGCTVLRHDMNIGKGRAIKTGLNYYLKHSQPGIGVITADADGQHKPSDIRKIADTMAMEPNTFVLGVRNFKRGVPLRGQIGNGITRRFFALINGETVTDTQTGLRGLPDSLIPLFLSLEGDRYEYEMNMLLTVRPHDLKLKQVPIETIYIENNQSSHFDTIRDSLRIYRLLFSFILSSLFAAFIDYSVFIVMNLMQPNRLFLSVVTARVCSSLVNFLINRNLVFRQKSAAKSAILRYYMLVVLVMLLSYGAIQFLSNVVGVNVYLAKLVSDSALYFLSFFGQRDFVYRKRKI